MTVDAQPSAPSGPPQAAARSGSVVLKPVFIPAAVVIVALMAFVLIFREQAQDLTTVLNEAITEGVGWWYVIAVNVFLVFVLFCAFTKIGRIRLGRDDERPEFSMVSWFMMLFSAGMGIGLVFFGVAEPLSNFLSPPEAFENAPMSIGAAQDSVGLMMLQWGLHPWAIYTVVGLGIAYMTFRRGRPLAVRWLLEPLLGRKRIEGWMGHTIDTIAIVGTLFGIATSFGFGVSQIIAGLEYLGWAESSPWLIISIITVITAIAIWSVVSGVHKGLKWLSNINMTIAACLALVVFLLGPTIFLLQAIPGNAGSYLSQLTSTMLHTGRWSSDGWESVWTIAYWGWWTSWAPFVGMFIARISRGRTIREFVIGVLAAPTAASLVWFTIFGESSMLFASTGQMDVSEGIDSTTSLFQFLDVLPMAGILSFVAIVVVVFFFVTSSDSGSLVIDMLACGGLVETPTSTRVFWSVLEGAAAAVLLVVGGDLALTALQTVAVSTAAPFSVILVLACFALYRAFRHDVATMPEYMQVIAREEPEGDARTPTPHASAAQGPTPAQAPDPDQSATPAHPATPAEDATAAQEPTRTQPATPAQPASSASQWQDAHARTGEPVADRVRRGVTGLRGVSASLAGLTTKQPGEIPADETTIVSYRPLGAGNLEFDPMTGRPILTGDGADPLRGEVFFSDEFMASQEYIDQGRRADLAEERGDLDAPTPAGHSDG